MIRLEPDTHGDAGVTTLWLRPNRALSRRGIWVLGVALVVIAMVTALMGAHAGNVFAPLFALIESLIVAGALVVTWRRGNRSERIRLDADVLEVEARPGRRRTQFPSGWVRVSLHRDAGRQHLLLASHGRRLEIGAFLADPEREALLEKLNAVLQRVRAPQA